MAAETLLSSLLGLLFLGLLSPARLTDGVGSLNLEELSEMRYGIQILPLPVMGGQVSSVGGEGPVQEEGAHGEGERASAHPAREAKEIEKIGGVPTALLGIVGRPIPRGPGTGWGGASRCGPRVPSPGESTQTPPV